MKIKIKNEKIKYYLTNLFKILNRFAPYIEIVLLFYVIKSTISQSNNQWSNLLYIIPLIMAYRLIKWEYKAIATKEIIRDTAYNKRVQGFCGFPGCGKTSFMLFCSYVLNAPKYYSNFPCKIRNKYVNELTKDVLNMDKQIDEKSICMISEASMFYHNIMDNIKDENTSQELYSQQLHTQILRHAYNGNFFYDTIELNRLPQMLRENIGLTNYMIGQHSKTFSFIVTPIIRAIANIFDIEILGNMRVWDVQQFEKIPMQNYIFDLSTQEKDTNLKNYANLIECCAWCDVTHFDYDDRFLRGLYEKLPKNIDVKWNSLKFSDKELRDIGYGKLIDFFNNKLSNNIVEKQKENIIQ